MSVYLIDYENVQSGSPLCGIDNLTPDDEVFLFYSDAANKIKEYYWDLFNNSICRTHLVKLKNTGHNALDFYISVQVGICIGTKQDKVAIISNDKDFRAVIEYSGVLLFESNQNVISASCIDEARKIFENEKSIQKKVCSRLDLLVSIKEPVDIKNVNEIDNNGINNKPARNYNEFFPKVLKVFKK